MDGPPCPNERKVNKPSGVRSATTPRGHRVRAVTCAFPLSDGVLAPRRPWSPTVLDVGFVTCKPELGVDRQRRRVVALDVQDDLPQPTAPEVPQPGERERPPEPAALRGRVDAHDVHLADALPAEPARRRLV